MRHRASIALALLLLLSFATAATALENRYYVGGAAGSWVNDDDPGFRYFDFGPIFEDDDIIELFGGVHFTEHIAVEARYHDLGSYECCDYSAAEIIISPPFFEFDREGLSVSVVGSVPVGRLRFFGKAGLLAWKRDGVRIELGDHRTPMDEEGSDVLLGAGLTFQVAKALDLRAEYQLSEVDGQELQGVTAGIQLRF